MERGQLYRHRARGPLAFRGSHGVDGLGHRLAIGEVARAGHGLAGEAARLAFGLAIHVKRDIGGVVVEQSPTEIYAPPLIGRHGDKPAAEIFLHTFGGISRYLLLVFMPRLEYLIVVSSLARILRVNPHNCAKQQQQCHETVF